MAQSELAIHVPVEVFTQLDMTDLLAKSATIEKLFKTAFISTNRHTVLHSLKKGHGKVEEEILRNIANRYGRRYVPLEARNKPQSITSGRLCQRGLITNTVMGESALSQLDD